LNFSQITTWHNRWWLIVDTDFETSWTPVDELNGTLGLDGGNGSVDVLWHDITSVQHTTCHVFTAFDYLVGWFEDGVCDFGNSQLLVIGLLGRDDGRVCGQRKVNTRVWYQVSLKLGQIDVQGSIESQRGRD